ncbi:MAG: sugar phosphate isomerase/epimerase [Acidimicrobiia bacterium]
MHPRLSVSAVSSWGWSLNEDLAFWSGAGIDHVGLSFRKLEEAGLDVAVTRVRDAGLRVSNIVELGWWDLATPTTWSAQQTRLLAAVDAAAMLGGCLVMTTGPAGLLEWSAAADALATALEPVQRAARAVSVPVTIEHTGPLRLDLSFCTTARDGVDLARRVGTGLCLEVNSCFAERDLTRTIMGADDVLAHVQVSDFVIGSLSTPDRAVPGDGDIPLGAIVRTVLDRGYSGAFELEIVGPRIEAEGYESTIRRGVAHLEGLLDQSKA